MFFQIHGLEIALLEKAKPGIVPVEIIVNHLTEDDEGETILKSAFNKETIQEFFKAGAIIDWWHNSKNPKRTDEEQAEAVLGHATGFKWKNGKPTIAADLTESHPVVQKMLPHLEAKQPVYSASVGGSKKVLRVTTPDGHQKSIVPTIKMDHVAIAPAHAVINREPGVNISILKKANDIMASFDNIDCFKKQSGQIFGQEEKLRKALLAPQSSTDLYETSGGVVTKQSLEKSLTDLTFGADESLLFLDTILNIIEKNIPLKKKSLLKYFEIKGQKDFGDKFYRLIDKYFKLKGAIL
jgi:hypothetical protein